MRDRGPAGSATWGRATARGAGVPWRGRGAAGGPGVAAPCSTTGRAGPGQGRRAVERHATPRCTLPTLLWEPCSAAPRRMRYNGVGESVTESQECVVGVTENMQCSSSAMRGCRVVRNSAVERHRGCGGAVQCSHWRALCHSGYRQCSGRGCSAALEGAVYCHGGMQCRRGTQHSTVQGMQ